MEQIKIENLSFKYPLCEDFALNNVSLKINKGDFILICGESGSGKTTLLRQLKKELIPQGEKSGKVLFENTEIDKLSLRESAEKIGFVMQSPDTQIVTDKVWHELAFGLENLGMDKDKIRLRVAEMASFFGISEWFNSKTDELSGGQMQILNLASIMVMHPDVLILDEPTSQLDPIAGENFLFALSKINRELGVNVILSEHSLEEAFKYADTLVVMDKGAVAYEGKPEDVEPLLSSLPEFLSYAVPGTMRIFNKANGKGECPLSVRDARLWLENIPHKTECEKSNTFIGKNNAIELKDVCFGYAKNNAEILKNLTLNIPDKSFFAILGGNAAGKTTLLKIMSGLLSPFSGKVKIFGEKQKKSNKKIAVLPQDVKALFTAKTVLLDLMQVENDNEKIKAVSALTEIENLLDKHPFDLSGGEQQRAALAKVLLCESDIVFLDEPTKGMDAEFKTRLAKIINTLKSKGVTVVMISHDIEFCASYADQCAMLFDGEIACVGNTKAFFNENRFYTTVANRISRGIIKNAVTDEDILSCLKEN